MPSEFIIDNKKYVILAKEQYESLLQKKVHKQLEGELLTLEEARQRSLQRIDKWEKAK